MFIFQTLGYLASYNIKVVISNHKLGDQVLIICILLGLYTSSLSEVVLIFHFIQYGYAIHVLLSVSITIS